MRRCRATPPTRTQRADDQPKDDGFAGVWLLLLMMIFLLVGGLSLDLWRGFSERRAMAEMAESAARAGANAVDLDVFDETGTVDLDPALARELAAANLGEQTEGRFVTYSGITADTETVTVEIRGRVPVTLLSLVGLGSLDVAVSAEAEPRIDRGTGAPP
jgi:Flp pilus assembly protein TadG